MGSAGHDMCTLAMFAAESSRTVPWMSSSVTRFTWPSLTAVSRMEGAATQPRNTSYLKVMMHVHASMWAACGRPACKQQERCKQHDSHCCNVLLCSHCIPSWSHICNGFEPIEYRIDKKPLW